MGINDLLAEIKGDGGKTPARETIIERDATAKRKAESDLRGSASKSQRRNNGASHESPRTDSLAHPIRPAEKAAAPILTASSQAATSDRRHDTSSRKIPTKLAAVQPTSNGGNAVGIAGSERKTLSSMALGRSTPAPSSVTKAPPKKGSYLEIMDRAQKAQATMGPVGKIQHKPTEKLPSKRERQELKAERTRMKKSAAAPVSRHGSGRAAESDGAVKGREQRSSHGPGQQSFTGTRSAERKNDRAGAEAEKKTKKAALATTGYQGTARPRPGATSTKPNSTSTTPETRSARGDHRLLPFQTRRRSRLDKEFDDDLDDFIEYDDEDPEDAGFGSGSRHRYGYHSEEVDDESDMEAGLSDIDQEERRAEYYARKEDEREERVEQARKREKEARKNEYIRARAARTSR